jgi:hypothetical protein
VERSQAQCCDNCCTSGFELGTRDWEEIGFIRREVGEFWARPIDKIRETEIDRCLRSQAAE